MGWWNDETGAERAARIKGENQAAHHARQQDSKQQEHERRRLEKWESENSRYRRDEYKADLDAWKANPAQYERQYASPYDVPDLPGDPRLEGLRAVHREEPPSEGVPALAVIAVVIIAVFFVLPALFKMVMPVVASVVNTVWIVLLAAVGALTLAWLVLKITAGDDPVRMRRAMLFNPARIGKVIYQVVREQIAERRARKTGAR